MRIRSAKHPPSRKKMNAAIMNRLPSGWLFTAVNQPLYPGEPFQVLSKRRILLGRRFDSGWAVSIAPLT
jgi:hypothetical protein